MQACREVAAADQVCVFTCGGCVFVCAMRVCVCHVCAVYVYVPCV